MNLPLIKNNTTRKFLLKYFLFFFITFHGFQSFSQTFYLKLHGGYNLPAFTHGVKGFDNDKLIDGNNYERSEVLFSLGAGLNFGGALGFVINDNLGFEIGGDYLISNKISCLQESTLSGVVKSTSKTLYSKNFQLTPTFVLSTDYETINPYGKIGFVIGFGKVYLDEEITQPLGHIKNYWEFNNGVIPGLKLNAGVDIRFSETFGMFAEFGYIQLSFKPSGYSIVKATYNDENILDTYTISQQEIIYVDSYIFNYSVSPDPNTPTKEARQNFPFASFRINIGGKINF